MYSTGSITLSIFYSRQSFFSNATISVASFVSTSCLPGATNGWAKFSSPDCFLVFLAGFLLGVQAGFSMIMISESSTILASLHDYTSIAPVVSTWSCASTGLLGVSESVAYIAGSSFFISSSGLY